MLYLEEILTLKRMENKYNYFKRDISWLSFNYRVLLEAQDEHLPLYERINFISIYSSNLEEFYKIRVADHKAVASGATESDEESVQSARDLVEEINQEVPCQLDDRVRIYEEKILPALRKNHIIFYQDSDVEAFINSLSRDSSKKKYSLIYNLSPYQRIKSSLSYETTDFILRYGSTPKMEVIRFIL